MKAKSTPRTSRIKITDDIRKAHEERDRSLDNNRDAPRMAPEFWANATVGKYYRPNLVFLSKIEHVFSIPTRGCVIVPVTFAEERVSVGDGVHLRSPGGQLDAQITGIELIKHSSGPCKVGFLLSKEISKSQIPPEAEIWIEKSK